jgi:hypothetical protein
VDERWQRLGVTIDWTRTSTLKDDDEECPDTWRFCCARLAIDRWLAAQAQDDLDKRAAKAAIEADGYKRVNVLGKGANGSWRATAYRGSTEVQLTVDGTGRVSVD